MYVTHSDLSLLQPDTRRRLDCHPLRPGGPPSGGEQLPGITQPTAHLLLIYGAISPTSTVAVTADSVVGIAPHQLILVPVLLPKGILRTRTRSSVMTVCFACKRPRPGNGYKLRSRSEKELPL